MLQKEKKVLTFAFFSAIIINADPNGLVHDPTVSLTTAERFLYKAPSGGLKSHKFLPDDMMWEPLAQLAEHLTFNQRVRSSSLRWLTKAVCLFDRPLFLFFLPWHTLLNRFFSSKPRFWPVKRFWKPRSYGLFDFVYNFFICADEAKTALFLHKMSQNKLFSEQPIFDAFEKSYNIQLNGLLHEVNIVRS